MRLLTPLVAWRSLLEGTLTVRCMCWLGSGLLLAGDEGGPRETEAMPPERRARDEDIVRSLSLSAMSVIARVARWAAERRGREEDMAWLGGEGGPFWATKET